MNNQESYTDLFDRYLRKELNEAERAEFDENLLNDDAFNQAFIEHKTLALGIRDFGKTELKDYLKIHATMPAAGKQYRISRTLYAMAAVLLLFVGVYAIISFYIAPNHSPVISMSHTEKKKEIAEDTTNMALNEMKSTVKSTDAVPRVETEKMESPVISSAVPPENMPDMATASGKAGEDMNRMDDAAGADREGIEYKVLSDYKTADTVLIAVYAIETIEIASNKYNKDKESSTRKAIPSSANNNYNKNETVVNSDTSASLKKKANDLKTVKYNLEFWQSPVNFKGYKMKDKTIQLYGLSNKINLYSYGDKLYLRNGQNVYVLTPCTEGCVFKSETDQTIFNLILKQ